MKKTRILLVEDDQEMCEELLPILEDHGYLVEVVHEGKSAIAFLEKNRYGMLLLDLKMPGINGYEVLKYAKKLHPEVKIVVVSGSPLQPGADKPEEQIFPGTAGYDRLISQLADGFVNKPFEVETILAKIRELFPEQGER